MVDVRANFSGSIPEYYDSCMGPAIFSPFADDLVRRLAVRPSGDVLEIACGTGIVTRRLRSRLEPSVRLVASDLSRAMLDYARRKLGEPKGVEWREADACRLPFADGEFGAVVCAFGVMFVPDRQAAFREVRRVLKAGGTFLFNVWDRIEEVPHGMAGAAALESFFPGDPEMRFTTPYEMHDPVLLRELLAGARFQALRIETKRVQVDGASARTLATGQIRGTPRSALIEKRGVSLDAVIDKVTEELARVGGADPYRSHAQAVVVEACALPL
jgi:SAM-dependent methyltransferase